MANWLIDCSLWNGPPLGCHGEHLGCHGHILLEVHACIGLLHINSFSFLLQKEEGQKKYVGCISFKYVTQDWGVTHLKACNTRSTSKTASVPKYVELVHGSCRTVAVTYRVSGDHANRMQHSRWRPQHCSTHPTHTSFELLINFFSWTNLKQKSESPSFGFIDKTD